MASASPHATALLVLQAICFFSLVAGESLTLGSVRDALVREEDTIVFCLIERARYPTNSPVYYDARGAGVKSLLEAFVRESEEIQAKYGRYVNPEEIPFFPDGLPIPLITPKFPNFLYPAAASVNVSSTIWKIYTQELLPLFIPKGDDGNYASTAASDLVCLQALSRRIHYGRFVAEVKFRDSPQEYRPAILSKDNKTLEKLLTNKSVEEDVKTRVLKKAKTFGQNVTLNNTSSTDTTNTSMYKVDPLVAERLYSEWIIPLTKVIEVEYLLHRLD